MKSTSPTFSTASTIDATSSTVQPQIVHSTTRTNSMPSWRGYLPMNFEPMTTDQNQITSHFSQKVFLGGIPPVLTEGKLIKNFILLFF